MFLLSELEARSRLLAHPDERGSVSGSDILDSDLDWSRTSMLSNI